VSRVSRVLQATALSLSLLIASCGPAPHSNERYVFVAANINIPYWQSAKAGFLDSGKALKGAKVEFVGPSSYAPNDELKAFQDAVASAPAGILVSPAQSDLFKDAIDTAVSAGIPVVCVDSDSPGSHRILFIGTDNYRAGMESGKTLAALLYGHGGIVMVKIAGQNNQEERARGVRDAIRANPAMAVGAEVNDSGSPDVAGSEITNMIRRGGHPAGILCLEATCGAGVASALEQLGMAGTIPIVAMDADPKTLTLVSQGMIAATVAQKPYTMGYFGLRFLDDLHHNRVHEFPDWRTAPVSPLPDIVDTGTMVINTHNVQAYLAATQQPQ
jgi:ribose transport system substrate-binding protein